jgi:SAM-dependent methyltransferase
VQPKVSQRHLALVLAAALKNGDFPPTIRILDTGCGDAQFLAYLAQTLPGQCPGRKFEFYGFEVGDIGWRGENYRRDTLQFLTQHVPSHPWNERIEIFSFRDGWPYQPSAFEIILSNQVFEHVQDHAFVFKEIKRCLAPGGVSVHLFPVREVVWEGHAHMPLVHRIRSRERRQRVMLFLARLGFTKTYKMEAHFRGWTNLGEFAEIYSDVIGTMTNYKSEREIARLAQQSGLEADFSHTKGFFATKLAAILGSPPRSYGRVGWFDRMTLPLLKRLSSVTLTLRHAPGGTSGTQASS